MYSLKYIRLGIPALLLLCLYITVKAQPILYGRAERTALSSDAYKEWFTAGYNNYHPDEVTLTRLKAMPQKDLTVEIWMGTWCGDSRREVPRFYKILDAAGVHPAQVSLYGLGGSDSLYKQSPGHEEAGKGIFRVPVFIIYRRGKEIGRINEFHVLTLEKDLLSIMAGEPYTPNYSGFSLIRNWLSSGELIQDNISVRGLAGQLRSRIASEYELNSLGHLLLRQQMPAAALRIFQINSQLYPVSAAALSSLANGYLQNGQADLALSFCEAALEKHDPYFPVKEILKTMYEAWKKKQ